MSGKMVTFDSKSGLYMCRFCMLHYKTEELAKKCEEWDKEHNSCNFEIASQSSEALKHRSKIVKS
jgi:hypothetical protein